MKLKRILWILIIAFGVGGGICFIPKSSLAAEENPDFMIYSVYTALNMGNAGEGTQKDYYVNMGSRHGLQAGGTLEVLRRVPTYDLKTKRLFKDITFPIARLKVIFVERDSAVTRLDQMLPPDKTPAITPNTVIVGDLVRTIR